MHEGPWEPKHWAELSIAPSAGSCDLSYLCGFDREGFEVHSRLQSTPVKMLLDKPTGSGQGIVNPSLQAPHATPIPSRSSVHQQSMGV